MENPFADYGKIIKGKRFVGRQKEIAAIQNRIFGSSFGNLAIQGLPRIGKTSLAWNVILKKKAELIEKKIIPIRINVGSITNSTDFFLKLIKELHKAIKRIKDIDTTVFEDLKKSISEAQRLDDRNDFIEEYFLVLRENDIRVIYVLDEFDAVKYFFQTQDFQFLRELSYNPETEICLVTISRNDLCEIEDSKGTISNFYQTFTDLNLGFYNQNDLSCYWQRLNGYEEIFTDSYKNNLYSFAGFHPYLLDLYNFHYFKNVSTEIFISYKSTQKEVNLSLMNNYDIIIDYLKTINLFTKLLQAVVGPIYDITTNDAEKLERYGLIKKSEKKTIDINQATYAAYDTFSEDFSNYLNMIRRETPIWHLWSETEIKLRNVVNKWLIEKFGEDWVAKFRKLQKKEAFVAGLELAREREKRSFPETYSTNLLDFTYPADLFDKFMRAEWSWFKNIFGKTANDWKLKFDLLAKIRNPLAHNKENILKDYEKDDAIGYCKEIIALIDKWEKQVIENE